MTFSQNDTNTLTVHTYDKFGQKLYDRVTGTNNSWNIVLLEPGMYYIRIHHSGTDWIKMWMHATPVNLTTVNPGDTIAVELNATNPQEDQYFYRLPLENAMHYGFYLAVDSTLDAGLTIYKAPQSQGSSVSLNDFGVGAAENMSDLVVFGQYVMHTKWDQNMTGADELTDLYFSSSWDGQVYDSSMMLLRIYTNSGNGTATLTVTNGTAVPELSPTESIAKAFNNTGGPLWSLYKVTGFTPASGYLFNFAFTPLPGGNISVDYDLYASAQESPMYHWAIKPALDPEQRLDINYQDTVFSADWDDYALNLAQEEFYFTGPVVDRYLLLRVPDAVISAGLTGVPLLGGSVNVTITERAAIPVTVGTPLVVTPTDANPLIFSTSVIPNHFYQLALTATNSSNSLSIFVGGPFVYNSSGISLFPYAMPDLFFSRNADHPNTLYQTFWGKASDGQIRILIEQLGEGPFEVLITDITYSDIVLEGALLVFGALIGAALIGVVAGILFSRFRK
ncbi:MAG: hypothetical protein ACW976_04305 [Candidatus Ranarchaeia archaeon]|jgi:hypothetical protein